MLKRAARRCGSYAGTLRLLRADVHDVFGAGTHAGAVRSKRAALSGPLRMSHPSKTSYHLARRSQIVLIRGSASRLSPPQTVCANQSEPGHARDGADGQRGPHTKVSAKGEEAAQKHRCRHRRRHRRNPAFCRRRHSPRQRCLDGHAGRHPGQYRERETPYEIVHPMHHPGGGHTNNSQEQTSRPPRRDMSERGSASVGRNPTPRAGVRTR